MYSRDRRNALRLLRPTLLLAFTQRTARRGGISTPSYAQVIEPVHRRALAMTQAS